MDCSFTVYEGSNVLPHNLRFEGAGVHKLVVILCLSSRFHSILALLPSVWGFEIFHLFPSRSCRTVVLKLFCPFWSRG